MKQTEIKLSDLSAEQLKQLKTALREQSKARTGDLGKRWAIVDRMLHERDGDGYRHTTADILSALVAAKVYGAPADSEARAAALKMIQTRKQALVAKGDIAVGYKPTDTGIGLMTVDRAVAYLKEHAPHLLK